MSKDGFNIALVGLKLSCDIKSAYNMQEGIFIYTINKDDYKRIELTHTILFAVKEKPAEALDQPKEEAKDGEEIKEEDEEDSKVTFDEAEL